MHTSPYGWHLKRRRGKKRNEIQQCECKTVSIFKKKKFRRVRFLKRTYKMCAVKVTVLKKLFNLETTLLIAAHLPSVLTFNFKFIPFTQLFLLKNCIWKRQSFVSATGSKKDFSTLFIYFFIIENYLHLPTAVHDHCKTPSVYEIKKKKSVKRWKLCSSLNHLDLLFIRNITQKKQKH